MVNKVTTLKTSTSLSDETIQAHLDEMNAAGWQLVCSDNLNGWYRFFWEKEAA